jgi:hypothetical protein
MGNQTDGKQSTAGVEFGGKDADGCGRLENITRKAQGRRKGKGI